MALNTRACTDRRILTTIRLKEIEVNPAQPRRNFPEESIRELAESIRQYGLLSPLLVRRTGSGGYQLIAGERRLRALRLLCEGQAEAFVLPAFEQDAALIALIENLQRENLSFLEEAEAYSALIRDYGLKQEEIARRIGRSPSSVNNRLRLLRLPEGIRARICEAHLTERHARALLRLADEPMQRYAVEQAIRMHLNVRQLESLVSQLEGLRRPPRAIAPIACRDHRIFVNALMHTVRTMQEAGVGVTSRVTEKEQSVEIVVEVPRIKILDNRASRS